MTTIGVRLAISVAAALTIAACGSDPQPPRTPPPDAKRVDRAKAGKIAGRVLVEGTVPQSPFIDMAGDPVCVGENKAPVPVETVIAHDGGLYNVFVYIKDGLGNYYFDTPAETVRLVQEGCRYAPHVFGAQTGQPIEISNGDPTLHNVNAAAKVNRGFNFGQPMEGMKNTTTFTAPEVMVRFKCDVHGWMTAYAGIVDHPYFAVTGGGGTFELKNVPAGTYTIEAWHEKLGTQTGSVTVAENGSAELNFTFKTATATP